MTTEQLIDRINNLEAELTQIKSLLKQTLQNPPEVKHPWMKHAGMFQDEPLFDQVLTEIEIYRHQLDSHRPELLSEEA
jgi:tRNA(fMet)-specific endonuclease VapC